MPVQKRDARAYSRYASAGYREEDAPYIERVRAGSGSDNLRDLNRKGYKRDTESPESVFETGRAAGRYEQSSFAAALRREIAADRSAAVTCAFLLMLILALGAVWMGKNTESIRNRRQIEAYNQWTLSLISENEALRQQLDRMQSGERIRNLAQNQYGMLRRERAERRKIYIQAPENLQAGTAPSTEEPQFELLDLLLGLLDRMHIGI